MHHDQRRSITAPHKTASVRPLPRIKSTLDDVEFLESVELNCSLCDADFSSWRRKDHCHVWCVHSRLLIECLGPKTIGGECASSRRSALNMWGSSPDVSPATPLHRCRKNISHIPPYMSHSLANLPPLLGCTPSSDIITLQIQHAAPNPSQLNMSFPPLDHAPLLHRLLALPTLFHPPTRCSTPSEPTYHTLSEVTATHSTYSTPTC